MTPMLSRSALPVGLALAALMASTRSHHFATALHLPDASWAVFFLAGVYLRPPWMLPALLSEAALIDFAAVTWSGVSSFCISPAYGFLLPAYGALWLAGRWYAGRYRFQLPTLIPLAAGVFVAAAICELFSSGGFYFFSGRFAETGLAEFGARLVRYFPPSLAAMAFYVALAATAHAALGALGVRGADGSAKNARRA